MSEFSAVTGDTIDGRTIEVVLQPRPRDIGGMRVGRILPSSRGEMIGPFIFIDRMGPAVFGPGEAHDVLPHPHIGLATVTYLMEGRMTHRDSLGSAQVITPGAVNLMSAGRGIVHSERHERQVLDKGGVLSGVQTWLALPKAVEEGEPAFTHVAAADLPLVTETGVRARVILGSAFGVTAPAPLPMPTYYVDAELSTGASLPLDTTHEERALYCLSGDVEVDGVACAPGMLVVIRNGLATQVRARSPAHVMLMGGAAMDGPRYIWWNFVSSDAERVRAAVEDWRAGRFPLILDDRDDFIPAPPELPGRPRAQQTRAR